MKITIENNDFSNTRGQFVISDGKKLQNKQGGIYPNEGENNDVFIKKQAHDNF